MTTMSLKTIRCSVCGNEKMISLINSTNAFGSSDLDTRPPEMMRSTIHAWVHCCPGCGYCASDLSKGGRAARKVIQSPEYVEQLNNTDFPELANSFLCQSMIHSQASEWVPATWAIIHAVWVCDDDGLESIAATCRKRAATMLRKAGARGQYIDDQPVSSAALLIDILRRANELDAAKEVIRKNRKIVPEGIIRQIMTCQEALIRAGDIGCYTIENVFSCFAS